MDSDTKKTPQLLEYAVSGSSLPRNKHNVWVKVLCYCYKREKYDIIRKRLAYRSDDSWWVNYSNSENVFLKTKDDLILDWSHTKNFR